MNFRSITVPALPRRYLIRRCIGLAILLFASFLLLVDVQRSLVALHPRVTGALVGGLIAAACTAAGTLPALLWRRVSPSASGAMMGFGAGVMLAASAFSLIVPALAAASASGHGRWSGALLVGLGIVVGALLLLAASAATAGSSCTAAPPDPRAQALRRAWVFVGAISLHNIPEGLAIGVAFAGASLADAQALTAGISLQDLPEGLVVALALRSVGYAAPTAVALGMASGLLEPVAAVAGAAALGLSAGLLPWGMAFAAGAMLYAVSHEAIPSSHAQGNASWATAALVLGFAVMTVLDTAMAP